MNVAIIVAIVALASTIVGASIGAATNYILAVRRERAEKEKEDRGHAVAVKRAARLIDSELAWARATANHCIEEKRLGRATTPLLPLSTDARQKHLDTIASDLSDGAWTGVTIAMQAAETIRMIVQMQQDRAMVLPDDVVESIVPLRTNIDNGRLGLAPYHLGSQVLDNST
jgi:hypothetical protein